MDSTVPAWTDSVVLPRHRLSQLLAEVRSRIERVEPAQALTETLQGALLIDIRGDTDRTANGIVPGSLHIPRTVLEWRLDPDSEWRSPFVSGLDQRILLLCDHGFSSSLAVSTLMYLGFRRVADVIGGFEGWRQAGLPIAEAPPPRPTCELAGMRPPDAPAEDTTSRLPHLHWDSTFELRGTTGVSWYEPTPTTSLALIAALGIPPDSVVIDVGAGASSLVDCLLQRGFTGISVLDVSAAALQAVLDRLGPAAPVTRIRANVLTWKPDRTYQVWHDRAMFHFLVSDEERAGYLRTVLAAVQPGGALIIGTFAEEGPEHCSGLPVRRYSPERLAATLGPKFQVVQTTRAVHQTPGGNMQPFTWIAARRQAE